MLCSTGSAAGSDAVSDREATGDATGAATGGAGGASSAGASPTSCRGSDVVGGASPRDCVTGAPGVPAASTDLSSDTDVPFGGVCDANTVAGSGHRWSTAVPAGFTAAISPGNRQSRRGPPGRRSRCPRSGPGSGPRAARRRSSVRIRSRAERALALVVAAHDHSSRISMYLQRKTTVVRPDHPRYAGYPGNRAENPDQANDQAIPSRMSCSLAITESAPTRSMIDPQDQRARADDIGPAGVHHRQRQPLRLSQAEQFVGHPATSARLTRAWWMRSGWYVGSPRARRSPWSPSRPGRPRSAASWPGTTTSARCTVA